MTPIRRFVAAVVSLTACALLPTASGAVVPPKDCGKLAVAGKPYQVKADQISCATGRRYAKGYLTSRTKPKGWTCRRYPSNVNRVRFSCNDGVKVFFAIRR